VAVRGPPRVSQQIVKRLVKAIYRRPRTIVAPVGKRVGDMGCARTDGVQDGLRCGTSVRAGRCFAFQIRAEAQLGGSSWEEALRQSS
jgi:hypothetical protein